jgi:hypothetical protein
MSEQEWPPDDDEHRGHHRELWEEQAARAEEGQLTAEELHQRHSDALAASGDLARNLLMMDAGGLEVPTEVLRAQQTVAHWLMEVTPKEQR